MSVEGRKWAQQVIRRTDLLPRAKVVASVLAERHNGRTGQCTPGHITVARDAGIPERTAERAIGDLRDAKLIEVQPRQKKSGRGRTSDSYALLPVNGVAPKGWDQSATSGDLVADQHATSDGPIRHERMTNPPPVTDQPATSADEPIREPISEQGREHGSTGTAALSSEINLPVPSLNGNGNVRPTQGRPNGRQVEGKGDVDAGASVTGDRPHASVSSNDTAPVPASVSFESAQEAKRREDAEWLASPEGQAAERRLRRKWRLRPEESAPTPQEVSQP